jgi:lysozyme
MRATRAACVAVLSFLAGCSPVDETESIGEVEQEQVVCGVGPITPGIDVSYYQGKPDWKQVAASGVKFAIARINDGGFIDPEFDRNWKTIREVGMVRGSYQFFRSTKDPIMQADLVINKIGKLEPGDLPPVLDVELTDGADANTMATKIQQWVAHVEKAIKRRPIVYTGSYFWNGNVKSTAFADYPLWIAHYTSEKCPNLPSAWKAWAMWQYSSTGKVAGISGNVDMNRLNGDELVLADLGGNGYRAEVMSLEYPKKMSPGEVGTVQLVLKNSGARSWQDKTRLGTTEKRDRNSAFASPGWLAHNRVLGIEGEVKSGNTVTLKFSIVAPAEPGTYVEHFNMLQEGVAWFSDTPPGGGPKDDAIALTIDVSPSATSTASVGVTTGGGGVGGSGGADAANPAASTSESSSCAVASAPDTTASLRLVPWGVLAFVFLRRSRRS